MAELFRNLLISLGLLLRVIVESSSAARSIYRVIGGAFLCITLFKGLFPGYDATMSIISRPIAFLSIGIIAAYWREPSGDSAAAGGTAGLRTALSSLSAATLLVSLALGYNTLPPYRTAVHFVLAISAALFILRTGLADYAQKRVQDALPKSEEKFNKAFRSSPAVTTITDPMATGSFWRSTKRSSGYWAIRAIKR